jgi:hypothetical protein
VIFALNERLDDVARLVGGLALALAGDARTAASATTERAAAKSLRTVSSSLGG